MTPKPLVKREKNMDEFTDIQKQMLSAMLGWDDEYRYPYSSFEDDYGNPIADKKILKKEMRGLISRGWVEINRGGINDDGEVCGGTGFSINYERRRELEKLMEASL